MTLEWEGGSQGGWKSIDLQEEVRASVRQATHGIRNGK